MDDILVKPPSLYVNWTSRGARWTEQSERHVLPAPGGKQITIAKLSDGREALEVPCRDVRMTGVFQLHLSPAEIAKMEAVVLRQQLEESKAQCVEEAVKQCRLILWNGKSSFALMHETYDMPPDEDVVRQKLYVRCMTHEALKAWALSSSASIDPKAEEAWYRLLDDSDGGDEKK
jgi:hypothetical protein